MAGIYLHELLEDLHANKYNGLYLFDPLLLAGLAGWLELCPCEFLNIAEEYVEEVFLGDEVVDLVGLSGRWSTMKDLLTRNI